MFDVLFPRHGAVLNHNHGQENKDGLTIVVRGIGGVEGNVFVNGRIAEYDGKGFSSSVILQGKTNTISIEQQDANGLLRRELKVVWDKGSFKRYNFFIDDHSFFLADLARNKPRSLFEHFYLAFLKRMHETYGTKFTLNTFYRNDHDPEHFTLSMMPDTWRAEWEENCEWLRLAFHAYSEFPDRPYQNDSGERLGRDMDLIQNEIKRFAGEDSLIAPVVLHWAMARPEALHKLTERGVTCLEGQFVNPRTGTEDVGSRGAVCDVGYFMNLEDGRFLEAQGILHDFKHDITFFRGDCTANLWTPTQIKERIAEASHSPRDFISLASHEQYSFPRYFNYLPDHFERVETSIREVIKYGYEPVFFSDGLMGNRSWK